MKAGTPRHIWGIIGLMGSVGLITASYWIEYGLAVPPCPLCLLQRWVLCLLALLFFILVWIPSRICSFNICFFAGVGLSLALRQVWLQRAGNEVVQSCSAGLERLFSIYPFWEAVKTALLSAAECGKVEFTLLGWSLAKWSCLAFSALLILGILAYRSIPSPRFRLFNR